MQPRSAFAALLLIAALAAGTWQTLITSPSLLMAFCVALVVGLFFGY